MSAARRAGPPACRRPGRALRRHPDRCLQPDELDRLRDESALTVLDAGVLIAVLDGGDVHHPAAEDALREAFAAGDDLVIPASAYAECLVGPLRRGPEAAAIVDDLLDALPARVAPISRGIARAAAELRARHGRVLRLPDALVVATALDLRADRLLTTDARWPTLERAVEVVAGPADHLDDLAGS